MRPLVAAAALVLTVPLAPACAGPQPAPPSGQTSPSPDGTKALGGPRAGAVPSFRVHRPVRGLSHVWDVKPLPASGGWLLTERDSARLYLFRDGTLRPVTFPSSSVWVSGETGLMSLAIDPSFEKNRRFYTCQGGFTSGGHDVRVMAWRLGRGGRTAVRAGKLLGGMPTSSGRHGGCRLLIERETGALYVGTGDAAVGTNPRDLTSLGGKVLRLNRKTGAAWPDNPFHGSANRNQRFVYNYGHRNIQGLAQRKDGSLWSAEHGPDRDDEVNLLESGGDYGWNPVPGYNESVPMTDQSLPGPQIDAKWSSGFPTVATSGAVWVSGKRWGAFDGTLAVAALKASRVIFMKFDSDGTFRWARAPKSLREFGRIRSLTRAPNGDLLATTDNASDDGVLRIVPSQ